MGREKWVRDAEAERVAYQAKAESHRRELLSEASNTTADWRTELQLGVITDEDKESLINWMAYIKTLRAIDLSPVKDDVSYKAVSWPAKP